MKHLFRKGLLFGMGLFLGKRIVFGICEMVNIIFIKYVPRKYWDINCPEHPFAKINNKKDVKQNPIGFRKD